MTNKAHNALLAVALLGSLTGCSTVDDEPTTAETTSALTIGPSNYDFSTTCSVSGVTMHCCPPGKVMIGVHVIKNEFKCAALTTLIGPRFIDTGTVRNGMHTCPMGSVMVGLHVNNNQLACQLNNPPTTPSGEFLDYADNDGVMHVCGLPTAAAMAGIHVIHDTFTCDT